MAGGVLTTDIHKVRENYRFLAGRAQGAEAACVIKANAYGIGAEPIVSALLEENCRFFYCFSIEKAVRARAADKDVNIAYFSGPFDEKDCEKSLAANLIPVLNTYAQISLWRKHCRQLGRGMPFMLHIDTGMRRFGFSPEYIGELHAHLEKDAMLPHLCGVISHLACADAPDHPLNGEQLERMRAIKTTFPGVKLSLANTSGTLLSPDYVFDQIRIGVGLYGVHPHPGFGENPLKPAVRLDSFLCQVRRLANASPVGYGAETVVPAGTVLGTIPMGYADGLRRSLPKNSAAYCMIGYTKCRYVGRISMDLTVIDVTAVPEKYRREGASVEIFGDRIAVEDFAEWCGTIPYEIFTGVSVRVKRRYASGV